MSTWHNEIIFAPTDFEHAISERKFTTPLFVIFHAQISLDFQFMIPRVTCKIFIRKRQLLVYRFAVNGCHLGNQ